VKRGANTGSAILNIIQTIAIVGSLALTLVLAAWNHSTQLREQDAESNLSLLKIPSEPEFEQLQELISH